MFDLIDRQLDNQPATVRRGDTTVLTATVPLDAGGAPPDLIAAGDAGVLDLLDSAPAAGLRLPCRTYDANLWFADTPADQLLTALRGKDVVLSFVESYGRDAVEDPEFATQVGAVLDDGTKRLAAKGFSARSAFLTSSTVGGGSWLAHATLLSGLWVDNQQRYRSLVGGDRLTLNRAFQRAGWRTVAVRSAPSSATRTVTCSSSASSPDLVCRLFRWPRQRAQRNSDSAIRYPDASPFAAEHLEAVLGVRSRPVRVVTRYGVCGSSCRSAAEWRTTTA